jgi:hypothetical protein
MALAILFISHQQRHGRDAGRASCGAAHGSDRRVLKSHDARQRFLLPIAGLLLALTEPAFADRFSRASGTG